VLLLFALVLGLSALVASIAPPPETRDEPTPTTAPAPPAAPVARAEPVAITVPAAPRPPVTRRVAAGSSFTLRVSAPQPGDVVIDGLGLRQSADPLAPARFDLLAEPPGRFAVSFEPLRGDRQVVARLEFVAAATVTPRSRAR